MHIFEREEMPPPRPSSWRPWGSGEPRTERKIGGQRLWLEGREEAENIMAREVPPRYWEGVRYARPGQEKVVALTYIGCRKAILTAKGSGRGCLSV